MSNTLDLAREWLADENLPDSLAASLSVLLDDARNEGFSEGDEHGIEVGRADAIAEQADARDELLEPVREAVEALTTILSDYTVAAGTVTTMPDAHEEAVRAVITDLEEVLEP
jgi:hypothetical protein